VLVLPCGLDLPVFQLIFFSQVVLVQIHTVVTMPVDSPETMRVGALEDITYDRRRSSVISAKGMQLTTYEDGDLMPGERHPTPDELHGPTALRRVAAPIPWAVYTVAFVELCERFSYYGTQVVCKSQ